MTLWVHILDGRKIKSDKNDRSWLYKLSDALDALCERDGVDKLSSFFDYTDLEYNMADDDAEEDEDEPALDAETGWAWGVDDMDWFPAASGLATLKQLELSIAAADEIGDLPSARKGELASEVADCVKLLEAAAKRDRTFHFTVIM